MKVSFYWNTGTIQREWLFTAKWEARRLLSFLKFMQKGARVIVEIESQDLEELFSYPKHNFQNVWIQFNMNDFFLQEITNINCLCYICHGGRVAITFLHRKYQFTSSQGPLGTWLWPRKCRSMSITGQKSNHQQYIANCGCPGHDIIPNVHEMAYAVTGHRIHHNPEV